MTTLGGLAYNLRREGKNLQQKGAQLVQEIVVTVAHTVIDATPVDTGQARNGWITTLDEPSSAIVTVTDDPSGSYAKASAYRAVAGYTGDKSVYISNNQPYIARLNSGYSAQAPANFVEAAIEKGRAIARRGFKG